MTHTKSASKPSTKKTRVLGDHKQVGKRFLPPLAQLNFESVSYIELGIPELLWLALLNEHFGQGRAAEVAARIARLTVSFKPPVGSPPNWSACATVLGSLGDDFPQKALDALAELRSPVAEALGPVARQYPGFPLAFLSSPENAKEHVVDDLEILKSVLDPLYVKRGVAGIRMQATGIYMAFLAEQLVVAEHSRLANFTAIERYPETEESRELAPLICAAVNGFLGMTFQSPGRKTWAWTFWNRGLELEPIDASLVDLLAREDGIDVE